MISSRVASTYELRIGGVVRRFENRLEWSESVHGGSRMKFELSPREAQGIELGMPVEVSVRPDGDESRSCRITLWCNRLREGRGKGSNKGKRIVLVEACDPLVFATDELQFRTYPGRTPMLNLAAAVLETDPGMLEGLRFGAASPFVESEFVLQGLESTREFLRRLAASTGHVVVWSREELVVFPAGAAAPNVEAVDASKLPRSAFYREYGRPLRASTLSWADGAGLRARVLSGPARQGAAPRRAAGVHARVAGATRPRAPLAPGARETRPRGRRVRLVCDRGDLRVGAEVHLREGPSMVVESVAHRLGHLGAYRNTATLVTREAFGLAPRPFDRGLLGPFHAQVTHNDDPDRRSRVRTRLLDDPAGRSTPWIPVLLPAVGAGSGMHWLPEVGELVLVVAPGECPEALTVLGGVRGAGQQIPESWGGSGNDHKVLASSRDVQIAFDDQRKVLVLTAGSARLEVSERDGISLVGKEVHVKAERRATISGDRIELG